MINWAQIKQKISDFSAKTKAVLGEIFVPEENNNFLPKALRSKYLFLYGAALLVGKIALISLAIILPATSLFSAITSDRLIALVNQERASKNLPALALNKSLNSVADLKVNDMLAKDYFEHTSPSGVTPWHWFKQIGYNYVFAGENLAMGFTQTDAVFEAWMNSPSHRDNILNPNFQEMGLAVKSGEIQDREDTLAVLVFGKPASAVSQPKNQIAQSPAPKASVAPRVSTQATSLPSATPQTSSIVLPENIAVAPNATPDNSLETVLGLEPENQTGGSVEDQTLKTGYTPRILGAFVSKSDEIAKSMYLYFALFLTLALLVNIFVKIKIQYGPTIVATTLIIILSAVLVFI